MNTWQRLARWRDERNAIAALTDEAEEIDARFEPLLAIARKTSRDEYERVSSHYHHEAETCQSQIDEIETARRIRSARMFGVPVPDRPKTFEDSEYWEWNRLFDKHLLSTEGHFYLRREIAAEREILYKPWLSWLAVVLSFVSLIVAVVKAIHG